MRKYIYVIFLLFSAATSAQDPHYTQFFNSPLTHNPAMTGLINGAVRVGAIYRNQWFSGVNYTSGTGFFNSPYQTPSVYIDAPISVFGKDAVGIGGSFLYDRAGAGSFGTFQGVLSASYIKALGKANNHQLSAGFQVGYTQLRLTQDDLRFANQHEQNNQFNGSIASNVGLQPNVGYVNANIGLLYYGRFSPRLSMYVGGAFFNAATMKYNLEAANAKRTLYYRYNVQLGFDVKFGKFHILPSILFMQQQKADQLNAGLGFGFDFDLKNSMTLGVYTRSNNLATNDRQAESVIPYLGVTLNSFKIAVSYDVTLTGFKQAGSGVGALEVSLIYIIPSKAAGELTNMLFCPRF